MNDMDQKDDHGVRNRFEQLRFSDEPPMATDPLDVAKRGDRVRRNRVAVATAGLATAAVIAAGVAIAFPLRPNAGAPIQFADGGAGTNKSSEQEKAKKRAAEGKDSSLPPGAAEEEAKRRAAGKPPTIPTGPPAEEAAKKKAAGAGVGFAFPLTRKTMLDVAVDHLDPQSAHLPKESTNVQTGGTAAGNVLSVGSRLDWVVRGEKGLGYVGVTVTSPGYSKLGRPDVELAYQIGCENFTTDCVERTVNGKTVWVGKRTKDRELAVLYQRPDGSLAGVGAFTLFGNNSETPVSKVDVSLEDAVALVTDPRLVVDTGEAKNPEDPMGGDTPGNIITK